MEDIKDKVEDVLPEDTTAPVAETTPAPADVIPADTPAETPSPVDEAIPKASDAFRGRIKSKYPDQEFADDEAFFQKASEELDNLEQYRNNNMDANKALMEIFDAEPVVAEVLKDMVKGASFREAIARHFSPDELMPGEGDPDEEGWKRNAEARSRKLADNEIMNRTRSENDEFSVRSIQEFAQETGLDEGKAEEFLTAVGEALDEVYSGKISKSFLTSMWKALNHENDVKNAEAAGKIAGKNEKINTIKETKPSGDGLPNLGGGGAPPREPAKKDWVSNLIDSEKKKQIL